MCFVVGEDEGSLRKGRGWKNEIVWRRNGSSVVREFMAGKKKKTNERGGEARG